jgi:MFS family permease
LTPDAPPLQRWDPVARAALQRRTLRVLVSGQVVGAAALGAAIVVGGFVVEDIVGVGTPWVGISTAAVTAGSGMMAHLLSRAMRRRGRRVGMQLGYALAATGGLVACAAVELAWLPLFLAGLLLYGAGSATNLLARYAATDLAEPDERSSAMGKVLFAATFGAIVGPTLVMPAEQLGQSLLGLQRHSGPWLVSAAFFGGAMINTAIRLRPDPLLALSTVEPDGPPVSSGFRGAMNSILSSPGGRLALASMVVAQAVMVGVMAMTPITMQAHHHGDMSPYVVSAHIAGMFAFSPLVGRYADRRGRLRSIREGAVVLTIACALGPFADRSTSVMFISMFTLGVGWALAVIGGSSLLVETMAPDRRVAAQGAADLTTAVSGGAASIVCGFVLGAAGFGALSLASALLVVPVLGAVVRQLGHPTAAQPA